MTRQEAIEILYYKGFTFCNYERCVDFYSALDCEKCEEALNLAIETLEQEPKRGKWEQAKDIEKEYAVCTNCKHHGEFYMDYCPNCGARMEVEK